MRRSFFQATEENPYHLSAGVIALSPENLLGVHYFARASAGDDYYTLVRESVEDHESLETAALRGLREEFGATGQIVGYLGARTTNFVVGRTQVEKTTAYLIVAVDDWDASKRYERDNSQPSRIEWRDADYLIRCMQAQGARLGGDLDESEIVKRFVRWHSSQVG